MDRIPPVNKLAGFAGLALVTLLLWAGLSNRNDPTLLRSPASVRQHDMYLSQIQPILNTRCIVCHACYNAPCQLNLTSYEGVERGATKAEVYHTQRLRATPPTRLFQDAKTASEWHEKFGFFPVTPNSNSAERNLGSSILHRLVTQRRATGVEGPFTSTEKGTSCPKNGIELGVYLAKNPQGGMPYGFPAISDEDYAKITDWIARGAPGPSPEAQRELNMPSTGNDGLTTLRRWERFLNGREIKTRIMARYLYEHLFLAHLHFETIPGDFYRLVRSRTAGPAAVDEIATPRPYDDPGFEGFHYRFRKVTSSIVHKTHITYAMSDEKMRRFRQLFLETDWGRDVDLPSYEMKTAANPFITFKAIPPRSRYQFMLDNALYHVMTFIHGPVCKGQVALDVIDDHFYIMFLNPDSDLAVIHPEYLEDVAKHLRLPGSSGDKLAVPYAEYKTAQMLYQKKRDKFYDKHAARGLGLEDLWDGDKTNDNAVLTVHRHYDSASVIAGARGGLPRTTWVMDYPIFERIYYDLVAGFSVYGNLAHQVATRRYMDNLRVESEDLFLNFLPKIVREPLRESWYQGKLSEIKTDTMNRLRGENRESRISLKPSMNPKDLMSELLHKFLDERFNEKVRGQSDHKEWAKSGMNRQLAATISSEAELDAEVRKLTMLPGPFVQHMPEISFLRVTRADGDDLVYTIIRNKAHLNISFMFLEDHYRNPVDDTLHFLKGFVGSYPNFFFTVPFEKMAEFLSELQAVKVIGGSFKNFVDRYGVRRTDARFWETSDWFTERSAQERGLTHGAFDLNRYEYF